MDDETMLCTRCGRPLDPTRRRIEATRRRIEAERLAAYGEPPGPEGEEECLCEDCAAETASAPEAVRTSPFPSPYQGEGQGEGRVTNDLSRPAPHPSPLPTGERGISPTAPPGADVTQAPAEAEGTPTATGEAETAEIEQVYRPPEARPTEQVLEEILREVKHIARNQEYEEFSVWNIFGGLVQCVVLFLLFWHYYKGEPDLMWAAVMQLLALTFFVLAKR